MMHCGNPLPWVDKLVHLGCIVSNNIDGGQVDMKQKVARYIDKNCTINQEFSFAHPTSKILINQIYNIDISLGAKHGICSALVLKVFTVLTTGQ